MNLLMPDANNKDECILSLRDVTRINEIIFTGEFGHIRGGSEINFFFEKHLKNNSQKVPFNFS